MRYVYILGVVLLFLTSCGDRKTTQTKHEFKSDTLSVNNSLVLKQNSILNDIYQLRPFDGSKPMLIDGKEYFNVSIIYDKSKFDNFEITESNTLNQGSKEETLGNKETNRSDNTFLYLGLFFILCLFVFLWLRYKK